MKPERKTTPYKRNKDQNYSGILIKTMQARQWSKIHKLLKEKNRAMYTSISTIVFQSEREIKAFSEMQNLREFIISRLTLQEILKKVFQAERK